MPDTSSCAGSLLFITAVLVLRPQAPGQNNVEDGFDQELALEAGLKTERKKVSNRTLPAVLLPAVRGSVWPEAREAGWQDEDISSEASHYHHCYKERCKNTECVFKLNKQCLVMKSTWSAGTAKVLQGSMNRMEHVQELFTYDSALKSNA
ncbi:uncharacterized [Tachysurus ichikawai]